MTRAERSKVTRTPQPRLVSRLSLGTLLAIGFIAGCVLSERGIATIQGTQPESPITGTATLLPTPQGLRASIRVTGAPPGTHGIHFHEKGDCGQGGNAAGGHYNPAGVQHGFLPKDGLRGAHAGDLGNIQIGPDGTGTLDLILPGLTLREGAHPVDGRAIILHEKADDFGQPTGNAGGRIACGVIAVTGR